MSFCLIHASFVLLRGHERVMTRPVILWLVVMVPKYLACPDPGISAHRTDRLDTRWLGRCSCTCQVRSFFLFFFWWESYSLHVHLRNTHITTETTRAMFSPSEDEQQAN